MQTALSLSILLPLPLSLVIKNRLGFWDNFLIRSPPVITHSLSVETKCHGLSANKCLNTSKCQNNVRTSGDLPLSAGLHLGPSPFRPQYSGPGVFAGRVEKSGDQTVFEGRSGADKGPNGDRRRIISVIILVIPGHANAGQLLLVCWHTEEQRRKQGGDPTRASVRLCNTLIYVYNSHGRRPYTYTNNYKHDRRRNSTLSTEQMDGFTRRIYGGNTTRTFRPPPPPDEIYRHLCPRSVKYC